VLSTPFVDRRDRSRQKGEMHLACQNSWTVRSARIAP